MKILAFEFSSAQRSVAVVPDETRVEVRLNHAPLKAHWLVNRQRHSLTRRFGVGLHTCDNILFARPVSEEIALRH